MTDTITTYKVGDRVHAFENTTQDGQPVILQFEAVVARNDVEEAELSPTRQCPAGGFAEDCRGPWLLLENVEPWAPTGDERFKCVCVHQVVPPEENLHDGCVCQTCAEATRDVDGRIADETEVEQWIAGHLRGECAAPMRDFIQVDGWANRPGLHDGIMVGDDQGDVMFGGRVRDPQRSATTVRMLIDPAASRDEVLRVVRKQLAWLENEEHGPLTPTFCAYDPAAAPF